MVHLRYQSRIITVQDDASSVVQTMWSTLPLFSEFCFHRLALLPGSVLTGSRLVGNKGNLLPKQINRSHRIGSPWPCLDLAHVSSPEPVSVTGICGEANLLTPTTTHSQSQVQLLPPKCQCWKIQSTIQKAKSKNECYEDKKKISISMTNQILHWKPTKRFLVKKQLIQI